MYFLVQTKDGLNYERMWDFPNFDSFDEALEYMDKNSMKFGKIIPRTERDM